MAESKFAGLPVHFVNGVMVPLFIRQEMVDQLEKTEHFPDDVWISCYLRAGTMWVTQIVRLIRNNGVQDDILLTTAVPYPESIWVNVPLDELARPRAFRSHFPYYQCPCGPPHSLPSKFIYVMRNPKDVAVSLYHFSRLGMVDDLEWDRAFQLFISGKMPYGDYFDHVLSWWAHKGSPNILFVKYEDMKKDLSQAVSKIASFLEVDLSPDVVQKIADLTTFESMMADNTANMSWDEDFNDKEGKPAFFRKGEVGDWKNYFSAKQSAEMDRMCEEKLKDTGIEFDYE